MVLLKQFHNYFSSSSIASRKIVLYDPVLLPGKSQEIYTRLFNALKNLIPEVAPATIVTNFEKAAINSFQIVFSSALIFGCFSIFHLSQATQITQPQAKKYYMPYRCYRQKKLRLQLYCALEPLLYPKSCRKNATTNF